MQDSTRTLAYICPVCGKSVAIERTPFQLAASVNHLPCPCGKSELVVEMMGTQCHIMVPCLFCGHDHKVSCPTHAVLHEKTLAFSCSASGLDCLYIGDSDSVFSAMQRLETAVDRLVLESTAEHKGAFLDELVMEEILEEIKEIASRNAISCTCGSHEYGIQVGYSSVTLVCAHCGGSLRIPAVTHDDIEDLCCKMSLSIHANQK